MKRPYELPHDMERHTGQEFKAKDLAMGADLERRLMIPCPVIRVILQHLTSRGFRGLGSGQVSHETKNMLDHWIQLNRPCLLPFLKLDPVPPHHVKTPPAQDTLTKYLRSWRKHVASNRSEHPLNDHASSHPLKDHASMPEECDGGGTSSVCTYCLSDDANQLLMLWSHYASPAPELLFLPVQLHKTVQNIVSRATLTVQESNMIASLSPGMHRFLTVVKNKHSDSEDLTQIPGPDDLSPNVLALLQQSLDISRECLRGNQMACNMSLPYKAPSEHEFETFLRTGTWAPHNPVMRTLPWFRRDYENYVSRVMRTNIKDKERKEAMRTLREETKRTGVTCNKYKEKNCALTPGLFTVFCLHCKICVAWELMEDTESPATAFRMFAHRAWTRQDFETFRRWRSEGVWKDQSVMCDAIPAENDDTTESVVVPDDDVDPCGGGGSSEW